MSSQRGTGRKLQPQTFQLEPVNHKMYVRKTVKQMEISVIPTVLTVLYDKNNFEVMKINW